MFQAWTSPEVKQNEQLSPYLFAFMMRRMNELAWKLKTIYSNMRRTFTVNQHFTLNQEYALMPVSQEVKLIDQSFNKKVSLQTWKDFVA